MRYEVNQEQSEQDEVDEMKQELISQVRRRLL